MNPMEESAGSYHHGDLRNALMDAAVDHIDRAGLEKLSLRALAREAGVSATAPYRHFPSKRCLLAALATRGFRELEATTGTAVADRSLGADARLTRMGVAYVGWAAAHPVTYQLMFGTDVIGDFSDYAELAAASEDAYGVLLAVLTDLQQAGRAAPGLSVSAMAGICWSAVHGLASLLLFSRNRGESDSSPSASIRYLGEHLDEAVAALMRSVVREAS